VSPGPRGRADDFTFDWQEIMAQTAEFASLKESVLQLIRKDIVSCVLAPGTVVRDNELAARYSMSTSPIREALVQLATERLIEMPPNRPKRIAPLDVRTAQDFFATFKLIALAGFAWGAPKILPENIDQMEAALAGLLTALKSNDEHRIVMLIRSFFMAVYGASGNAELIHMISNRLNWIERLLIVLKTHRKQALHEKLREIIDCITSGQFPVAIRIHFELLDGIESDITELPSLVPAVNVKNVEIAPLRKRKTA